MVQLIAFLIFTFSLSVVAVMLYRKFPDFAALPAKGSHGFQAPQWMRDISTWIQGRYVHIVERQMPLHRALSITKVLILKLERKVDELLGNVRKRTVVKNVKKKSAAPVKRTRRKKA